MVCLVRWRGLREAAFLQGGDAPAGGSTEVYLWSRVMRFTSDAQHVARDEQRRECI
jgi:hypothetical protein